MLELLSKYFEIAKRIYKYEDFKKAFSFQLVVLVIFTSFMLISIIGMVFMSFIFYMGQSKGDIASESDNIMFYGSLTLLILVNIVFSLIVGMYSNGYALALANNYRRKILVFPDTRDFISYIKEGFLFSINVQLINLPILFLFLIALFVSFDIDKSGIIAKFMIYGVVFVFTPVISYPYPYIYFIYTRKGKNLLLELVELREYIIAHPRVGLKYCFLVIVSSFIIMFFSQIPLASILIGLYYYYFNAILIEDVVTEIEYKED